MSDGENEIMISELIERIIQLEARVSALEGKPKKKVGKSEGSEVWDAYRQVYVHRYGVEPARNAKVNGQANLLVQRVGKDDAIGMVQFYLNQRDQFYVKMLHPLALCLKDAETLYTRMKAGIKITGKQAQQIEDSDSNAQVQAAYLERKHGRKS